MQIYILFFSFPFLTPSLLSVHDGWGIATEPGLEGNAIEAGDTSNMDTIAKDHSYRTLAAHGTAVGLSEGLMGNSEVGFVLTGPNSVIAS
jgi:2,3-bisphosphoglycerate-independent phosphoglycerate mutase